MKIPFVSEKELTARSESGGIQVTFDADSGNWSLVPVRAAFGVGPVHYCYADGSIDLAKAAETLRSHLVRSSYYDRKDAERGKGYWNELTLQLEDSLFVVLDESSVRVYAGCPEVARKTAERLVESFKGQPVKRPATFQIVKQSSDGIDTESVAIDDADSKDISDLSLCYGEDFPEWHDAFLEKLRTRHAGLSIFDGPPGTGKTSYLRRLLADLKESHRFYFISSANLRLLRDAEFVDFWASERRAHEGLSMVAILEDAESALMSRRSDNRQEVSLLLNITDGILGQFLKLHVICTVNCDIKELDPALLRPGRLSAHRRFGLIPRQRAIALADALGRPLQGDREEYALAEVVSGELDPSRRERPPIGFA